MSYEFNSKMLGNISEDLAIKWQHPEVANDTILLFSGIHKHTKKHDEQWKLGENSQKQILILF